VHAIKTDAGREEVLRFTAIEDVWGIGRQHGKRLTEMSILTAFDLLQLNDEWMRAHMTVMGQRLLNELKGISCIPIEEHPPAKKNICTSRSFGQLLTDIVDIKEAVANFAARCAAKLRKERSCAGAVQVFLHTNVHRQRDRQYSSSLTIPMQVATNNTQEIIFYALCGINKIYKQGYRYVKAGVMVHDIVPEGEVQQGLFDFKDRVKENYLIETVDAVNRSWGRDLVKYAVQGNGEKWKLRRQHLSPCYTTRLDQVLTIKI
jgi:DNA polymerase V